MTELIDSEEDSLLALFDEILVPAGTRYFDTSSVR